MKDKRVFNFQELIGKKFRGVRSLACKILTYDGKLETHLSYQATMIISTSEKDNNEVRDISIEGEWFEYNNGGDSLNMSFKFETPPYILFSSLPKDRHEKFPSQISISNFVISQIDIYGFNIDFNLVESTKHIVLLKSENGQEILIKPDAFELGLLFSFDLVLNKSFFEKSAEAEYIYHVQRFE